MLSNTGEKFAAGNAFVSGDWRSSRWCTVEVSSHRLGSNAFDNLIWPHFDTYNWPHLINKDAGPVRQKSYGPSRDGVQRKGRRLSPFLCTSNVEATPSAATMLSFSAAPPGFCESDTTRRRFR